MPRNHAYKASEFISEQEYPDPYARPSFSVSSRIRRQIWNICWLLLYRTSPRPFHGWRSFILRSFGAVLGSHCHFYPGVRIWAPWNLVCDDHVAVGDGAEIYNPAKITIGSHAIISQDAYICGATHDYQDPAFPLVAYSMQLGKYAWICARACVAPGVNVGDGAVLGLASTATKDLEPWTVYAGQPATAVRSRNVINS